MVVAGVTVTEPAVKVEKVMETLDELLVEIPCDPLPPLRNLLAKRFFINVEVVEATVPDEVLEDVQIGLDLGGELR